MAEVELPELPDNIAERCAALGYTENQEEAEEGWGNESEHAPGYTLLLTEKEFFERTKRLLNSISKNPKKKQELINEIKRKFTMKAQNRVEEALGELNLESWRTVYNEFTANMSATEQLSYTDDAGWYIKNEMIPKIDGIFSVKNNSGARDYCSSTPVPAGVGGRRRRKRKTKRKTKRKKRKTKRKKSKRRKSRKSKKTKRRRRRRK